MSMKLNLHHDNGTGACMSIESALDNEQELQFTCKSFDTAYFWANRDETIAIIKHLKQVFNISLAEIDEDALQFAIDEYDVSNSLADERQSVCIYDSDSEEA
jgi:hypothetical protein